MFESDTFLPEIPIVQPNDETPVLDKPLKRDRLDIFAKTGFLEDMVLGISNTAYALSGSFNINAASPIVGLYASINAFRDAKLTIESSSIDKKENFSDSKLGISIERCVYHGDAFNLHDALISSGDNFYHIQLPSFADNPGGLSPSDESLGFMRDLYNYTFATLSNISQNRDYKFLAVEVKNPEQEFRSLGGEPSTRRDVYAGHKTTPLAAEKQLLLFTKDELETLTKSPHDQFIKLSRKINDPLVTQMVELLKKTTSPEEKERGKRLLMSRLRNILEREVTLQFNGTPEMISRGTKYESLSVPSSMPSESFNELEPIVKTRQPIYPQTRIREVGGRMYFVRRNPLDGSVEKLPIDDLLYPVLPEERGLSEDERKLNKYPAATSAYELISLLGQSDSMDDLLLEMKPVTTLDMYKRLEDLKLNLDAEKTAGSAGMTPSRFKDRYGRRLMNRFAVPIALYVSLHGVTPDTVQNATSAITDIVAHQFEDNGSVRPGFDNKLPKSLIDWKIDGTLPANGYYVTDTSNKFENGMWKINNNIKNPLTFLGKLNSGKYGQWQILSKTIPLTQIGDTEFKLPMAIGSQIADVRIIDKHGEKVNYHAFEITDGTVKIVIPNSPLHKQEPYVTVSHMLVNTDKARLHAADRLSPIDISKLSPDVQSKLHQATSPDDLFDRINTDHTYSITGVFDKSAGKGPEEFVNAVSHMPSCDCDVCNTAGVLEASADNFDHPVNMAFGYIGLNDHNAGRGGFELRNDTRHAFAIDSEGRIYDGTPVRLSGDALTRQYVDRLHTNSTVTGVVDEWTRIENTIKRKAEREKQIVDHIRLMAELTVGSTGTLAVGYTALKSIKFFREHFLKGKRAEMGDRFISKVFDKEDFQKAYNFFGWLSWGVLQTAPGSDLEVDDADNQQLLNKVRGNIDPEKLGQYLESPKVFERAARNHGYEMSKVDALKLRILASRIVD